MEAREDAELVAASAEGDADAYAELVRRHSRRVFAACFGLLGRFEDAEDMAQEAFVQGFRRLDRLRDGGSFGAWTVKIARNLCLDHLRKQTRGRQLLAHEQRATCASVEDHSDLHDAISRLSEDQRLPLLMYYFDGHSSAGVARALGISESATLMRLCRARKALRRLLSGGGADA